MSINQGWLPFPRILESKFLNNSELNTDEKCVDIWSIKTGVNIQDGLRRVAWDGLKRNAAVVVLFEVSVSVVGIVVALDKVEVIVVVEGIAVVINVEFDRIGWFLSIEEKEKDSSGRNAGNWEEWDGYKREQFSFFVSSFVCVEERDFIWDTKIDL